MMKRSAIIALLSLLYTLSYAQIGRFYSSNKELSSSLVNAIHQDRRGFVWVATEDGLNRLDGFNTKIYKSEPDDLQSIKNIYVTCILEDSENNLWFGCIDGVVLYNYNEDSFTAIPFFKGSKSVKGYVTSMIERKNGQILVSTSGQGLFYLDKMGDKRQFADCKRMNQSVRSIYINNIIEDRTGLLWVATEQQGLYCLDKNGALVRRYSAPADFRSNSILAFCEDADGKLYIGSLSGGVTIYNPTEKTFTQAQVQGGVGDLNVRDIHIDSRKRVLVGTDGNGLWEYNRSRNTLVPLEFSNTPFNLSRTKVHTIYEDKDNNLWLGLFQKGVLVFPANRSQFDYYGGGTTPGSAIGNSCIMAIGRDKRGVIWVGTDNDGLYGIDDSGRQIKRFDSKAGVGGIPLSITSLLCDTKGTLWVGSYSNGLTMVNPDNGRSQQVQLDPAMSNEKNEKVFCLFEDSKANLWIGTYGKGIYRKNIITGSMAHYQSGPEEEVSPKLLPNSWVNCFAESRNGNIWIGTFNGLACLNPATSTFVRFGNRFNLLPGYTVHAVLEGADGTIWIGTSQGLFRYSAHTKQLAQFTVKNGLANNIICGIAEDEAHNLWISTHNGISKMVVAKEQFISYYAPKWIHNNEFTRGAAYKDVRGKLYFGGVEGISAFFPSRVKDSQKPLDVQITGLSLLNKPVRFSDKSGGRKIFRSGLSNVTDMRISYSDNIFTLDFSVFNYVNPEEVVFQYRIEEVNSAWVSLAPGVNSVTLTGLLPGKYSLSLRAKSGSTYSAVKQVLITITPPWYKTILAKIVYLLLLLAAAYFVYRFILSRIREKQELLHSRHVQEVNEQKLNYFINISHEIRTPMSLIIAPLEKLLKGDANPANLRLYQLMKVNAERILQLVNQLMDIRKLEMGQMVLRFSEVNLFAYLKSISDLLEPQLVRKSITLDISTGNRDVNVWIDPGNFDKVIFNLLSNALKFTPEGGRIDIRIEVEAGSPAAHSHIRILVEDSGIGIEPDKVEKIFERFYQISNTITKANIGTGIGLHLSRLLVDLHHGEIWAENKESGRGARFIVRIPLGFAHLRSDEMAPAEATAEPACPPMLFNDAEESRQSGSTSKRRSSGKRLLIVDDEPDIRAFLRNELSPYYTISEAENGLVAMECMLKERPDLVISDVMMPEVNGITLVKRIRQNININDIPIILLTAKNGIDENIEGLDCGADAYLVKPFNVELLRSSIENLIHVRERLRNKFNGNQDQHDKIEETKLSSADEVFIEKVMKVINTHIDDPMLNVEFIADKVGLSRVHVYRKLKALTNQSARDFIRNIRLKQAAAMLSQKHHLVADVAYATGFVSVSHFSTAFKEFYGVTPSEWMARSHSPKVEG